MAVTKRGQSNNQQAAAQTNGFEKAAAFLNIGLPTVKGDAVRVDSIKLKASNVVHARIIDRLSDPELDDAGRAAAIAVLKDLLIIDFQVVRSDEDKEIAF